MPEEFVIPREIPSKEKAWLHRDSSRVGMKGSPSTKGRVGQETSGEAEGSPGLSNRGSKLLNILDFKSNVKPLKGVYQGNTTDLCFKTIFLLLLLWDEDV